MIHQIRLYGILLGLLMALSLTAQVKEGVRTIVHENQVYIYHNLKLDAGYGFNIYRDGEQLNIEPVMGAAYPEDFAVVLGDQYQAFAEMVNADSPANLFYKLKSNLPMQRLASFLNPELATALGRLYIDSVKTDGQVVEYRLEIVNNLGEASMETYTVQVPLTPHTADSPTELVATNKGDEVTLKWSYSKTNKSIDDKIIQFNVFRQTGNGLEKLNEDIIIRNGARDQFKINFKAAQIGLKETYVVHAVDIAGQEYQSRPLVYQIRDNEPPSAIGGVTASVDGNSITISWNMGTDIDLAGYNVYRSRNMRDGYQRINGVQLDPLNTYFIDSTAREGKTFSYKVTAVDLSNNESEQSLAAQGRINDNIAPDTPLGLSASLQDQTIQLSWSPIENQSNFRSYVVLRKLANGQAKAYTRLNQEDLNSTQWKDSGRGGEGFIEGELYQYCLLAMDSARNFSDSVFTNVKIPDLTPPTPPQVVQATNQNGLHALLRWTASQSADTENYQLYRTNEAGKQDELIQLNRDTRQYKDTTVVKGHTYSYAVAAIDSLGNRSDLTSSDLVVVKDNDPPRSVRNVMIDLVNNQINWEPVVAFDLAGYNIYQADIPTGEYKKVNAEVRKETYFSSENLESGKWYRVRSIDISGNESKPSKPMQAK
ncbi:MAG: hypothetical protein AAFN93_05655 [Bacteroidota bacterium]